MDDTNVSFSTGDVATPHTLETHAYHIDTHINVKDAQTLVTADITSARNDTENESISTSDKKYGNVHLDDPIYNFFHCTDSDSTKIPPDTRNEIYSEAERKTENYNRQYATMGNDEKDEARTNVYEEVRAIKEPYNSSHKYDIQDYYEKYSPTTTKASIDTLFLSRHEICEKCARMKYSPVYTDRLIYTKESLFALEVVLCQRDDVSCFTFRDPREDPPNDPLRFQYDRNLQDYMLIYSYTKTNAAGIFYSHCWPQDVFDLTSLLKPNIYVLNYPCSVIANTQLYHRYVNNCYVRLSKAGCASMTFYRDRSTMINCMRCINYNNDNNLQDLPIYPMHQLKDCEYRRNRSSLLLLEPLLLTPELISSEHKKNTKNRVSERIRIIRILIAYALSFLILVSITFYIVYFT